MVNVAAAETAEGILDELRMMDAPQEVPAHLISAGGIARLLGVSAPQVTNWMRIAHEPKVALPFSSSGYYDWGALGILMPALRPADTSPVIRVMHDYLPGGKAANGSDVPETYARFLQLLLIPHPDKSHVPLDWADPVDRRIFGWLGGAACDQLQEELQGRRELVIARGVAQPVGSRSDLLPAGDAAQPATALDVEQAPDPAMPPPGSQRGSVLAPPRDEAYAQPEPVRPAVVVTQFFDQGMTPSQLESLGADPQVVGRVLREIAGTGDQQMLNGIDLQRALIRLFGISQEDAETYLGVRQGIIARYIEQTFGARAGKIRDPKVWGALLREFRPDMLEYSPIPDGDLSVYGFEDTEQLLEFILSHGGDFEIQDEQILLSYRAQKLLKMQLARDSVPAASDDVFSGWLSTDEMAAAHAWVQEDVLEWVHNLPRVVGSLDNTRMVWLRSRQAPHRVLPFYSPAVCKLFSNVVAQRSQEAEVADRPQRLLRLIQQAAGKASSDEDRGAQENNLE